MHISLAPDILGHIGSFPVSNSLVMSYSVVFFLLGLSLLVRSKIQMIPGKLQSLLEVFFEGALDLMDSVTGDRKLTKKFFPLVLTIFFFVLFANLIGILPGLGTIGFWEVKHGVRTLVPLMRPMSADLNFTIAVALGAVIGVQVLGIATIGAVKYGKKFFVPPWEKPYGVGTFVGILELVAEMAKVVSFSFRLFGNVFAGEVLLTVVLFLVPYIAPLPFLFLELFVGFVQAAVFSMLTLVFLKMGATAHDEHEAH